MTYLGESLAEYEATARKRLAVFMVAIVSVGAAAAYAIAGGDNPRYWFVRRCAEHRPLDDCERDAARLYPEAR